MSNLVWTQSREDVGTLNFNDRSPGHEYFTGQYFHGEDQLLVEFVGAAFRPRTVLRNLPPEADREGCGYRE
jgi:hypothetical protein